MRWKAKLKKLGNGREIKKNGYSLFKLSSYRDNPILKPEEMNIAWRDQGVYRIGAVFNGGTEIYNKYIIMAPRCHKNYDKKSYIDKKLGVERVYMENYVSKICVLYSVDGITFKKYDDIVLEGRDPRGRDFSYGVEDVRIIKFENNEYILLGCGKKIPPFKGSGGDRIAIYTTKDFKNIVYRGVVDEFDSRNALIFPRYIDGKLYMLFRFHPNIHIDILSEGLEQLYNPMKYSRCWRRIYENREHNLLIAAGAYPHEIEKIGGGTPPIETKDGWFFIYHSVGYIDEWITKLYGLNEPIVRGYSISAAILDINEPSRVLYRTKYPIYIPHEPWEYTGDKSYPVDVPYVVFPTGTIKADNKLIIYAGSGDKYMVLLSANIDSLVDYIIKYGVREM